MNGVETVNKNKVLKNASWIIVCSIIKSILSLIIGMITARYLGPSNYGIINYASSVVTFFVPIMQLGFTNIAVQEFVKNPQREGEVLGTTLFLSLISGLICICGVMLFVFVANAGDHETIIVCLLYSSILIVQSYELLKYWYQSKFLSKYTSIVSLCVYVIISVYKVFLLVSGKNVYWFALSMALDYLLIGVILFIIYFRIGGQKLRFNFSLGKSLFNRSKHYIVSSMMVVIFSQTDKIMLKILLDSESTGYYSSAVTIAGMTSFVFVAIIDSMRPSIFEGAKINNDVYEYRLKLLYSAIIYLSFIQSVIMAIAANVLVVVLYGNDYLPAASALRIIVWYTTFSYLGTVRNIWILQEGKQKYLWLINLSGAVANVILNMCLIPLLGVNGAALASLLTQFFTNVIVGFILRPIRKNNKIMIDSINPTYLLSVTKTFISRFKKARRSV